MKQAAYVRPVAAVFGVVVIAMMVSFAGCSGETQQSDNRLIAFVSIAPQEYIVERIGGDLVDGVTLVAPGQSPHTYEPTPQQMGQLERADVYFRIGISFENRLVNRVAGMIGAERIIDTREGIVLRAIEDHHHEGEEAEEARTAGGEAADPHIWLDPALMKIQAQTMAEALIGLRPEYREQFEARLRQLEHELDSVDAVVREILAPYKGRAVYVFHPAYGYFTDRYNLRQVAIESEGKEPSARELTELIDRAAADRVTTVFVQRQFAQKTAKAVAEAIGARVVVLDNLSGDYLNNMVEMAREIAAGLEPGSE